MKTVATFATVADASIVKGMLESNGIPCMIDNQAMSSLYPTPMSDAWDVSLKVNDSDYEKACKLMKDAGDPIG